MRTVLPWGAGSPLTGALRPADPCAGCCHRPGAPPAPSRPPSRRFTPACRARASTCRTWNYVTSVGSGDLPVADCTVLLGPIRDWERWPRCPTRRPGPAVRSRAERGGCPAPEPVPPRPSPRPRLPRCHMAQGRPAGRPPGPTRKLFLHLGEALALQDGPAREVVPAAGGPRRTDPCRCSRFPPYEAKLTPRSANILIASPRNSTILGW